MYSNAGWKSERLMTLKQWKELNERFDKERENIGPELCKMLSEEMNLDYYQILHLSYAKRKKYEKEMYEEGIRIKKLKSRRRFKALKKNKRNRIKYQKS